jgi:uncharacterized lipoprotein YajG
MIVLRTTQRMTLGSPRIGAKLTMRLVGNLLLATMIVACADKPLPVSFTYIPNRTVQTTSGSESIYIEVTVNDARSVKDNLGEATEGFHSIPLVTHDDLSEVIKSGVESELVNRGFELGSGNALIVIDLEEIAVRNRISAFSGDSDLRAVALLKSEVRRKTGAVLYSKEISGQVSLVIKDMTISAASQEALDYALNEAVRNLVADPAFMRAVLATGSLAKPAASAASSTPTPVASP